MKRMISASIPWLCVVFAALLLAFNYQLFIVENSFAPAGLNGIATMVQYKTGFSIGYMSLIINVPLCILAWFLIDRRFAAYSLAFCLVYSLSFLYLQKIGLENWQYNAGGHDTIYPVMLSGVISGFVYGVCFRNNASTGGTDIVSKYISKKRPEWNFFYVTFVLNVVVATASLFVYARTGEDGLLIYDYKPVCLCVLYSFLSSFIGSYIIRGAKTACKFTIITTHPDEISQDISQLLHHSSTKVTAFGSFSHDEKAMLVCVINRHQIHDLSEILKRYDNTFSFSETVNETYGNFRKVK